MSLNGLLDAVSCGSISSVAGQHLGESISCTRISNYYTVSFASLLGSTMLKLEPYSSYDSLEKYQCESETLKLTSDISKRSIADEIQLSNSKKYECSSQSSHKPQQQSAHQTKVPPIRPKYAKEQNKRNNEDVQQHDNNDQQPQTNKELEKQRQLSDWYYIKSSPTKSKHHHSSPPLLPPRPPAKRNTNSSADEKSLSTVGCGGNSSSSSRSGFLQTNRKLTDEHFSTKSTNNNVRTQRDDKYETHLKNNIESLIFAENTRNCIEIERDNIATTTNVDGVTCKIPWNDTVEVNVVSGKDYKFVLEPKQRPPLSQQEPQNKQYLSKGRFIRRQHIGGNSSSGCVRDSSSGCNRHDGSRSVGSSGGADVSVADEKAQMARKQFNVKHKSNLNNVRFGGGEVSSSSFEHVNCSSFMSEMTVSEKTLKIANNFDATSNDMGPGKYIWKPENDEHLAVSTFVLLQNSIESNFNKRLALDSFF